MNLKSLKQKALAVAIIGAFAQPALASDECNAGDGLNSWSAWCGIDTYLSQQEPTAAGPLQGAGFSGLSNRSLNTNEFGGSLNEQQANTAELIAYTFFSNGPNDFGLGKFSMLLDDDNQVANLKGGFDNGQAIDSDSNFYNRYPTYLNTGSRSEKTPSIQLLNDYWYAYAFANTGKQQADIGGLNQEPANIQDFTWGHVHGYATGTGHFHGSLQKATDLVDMSNLKATNATANFSVYSYGQDSRVGSRYENHSMFVDFGNGQWSMNDFYATNTSGTITGNQFQATSMVATNHRVISNDSFVEGTFTGTNASSLTGMANIVKLKSKTNDSVHKNIKVIMHGHQNGGPVPR